MTRNQLPLIGGPVSIEGAVSLEITPDYVQPWRLPYRDLALFSHALVDKAGNSAGVRIACVSDTSTIEVSLTPWPKTAESAEETRTLDLLVDGVQHQRVTRGVHESSFTFENIPAGEHRLEVYLPQRKGTSQITGVSIDKHASARRWIDTRPKWVVYGSSITQCGSAIGPSEIWPVLVANACDVNLTCLGYGGNCHLEIMVGRMIRDLPADLITMCLGINVQGGSSLSGRTFPSAVWGLVELIREKHPRTPMGLVSPIFCERRETTDNAVGLSLEKMRAIIHDAVDRFHKRGDQNIAYTSGLDVFSAELAGYMPDGLHPDARGNVLLAENYAKHVMPTVGFPPKHPVTAALLDQAQAAAR